MNFGHGWTVVVWWGTWACSLMLCISLSAEPTEDRDWTSRVGTKVRGQATEVSNGQVVIKSGERVLRVPVAGFSDADQTLLREHFKLVAPGEATELTPDDSITLEKGRSLGPIQAAKGSSYFLYIPNSLPAGRKHPLMMILMPHRGNANTVNHYRDGAERNGWILMTSVESENSLPWAKEEPSVLKALEHAKSTLPIDPTRIYFTGFSGGSSGSFTFANQLKLAGVIGCGMGGAYSNIDKIKSTLPIYFVNGTNCWNRGDPGQTIAKFCPRSKDARIRYFPGKHEMGQSYLMDDAITHLHHVTVFNRLSEFPEEAARSEATIYRFAKELQESAPGRALMWTSFLKARPVDRGLAASIDALHRELLKDVTAVGWLAGLDAIQELMVNKMGRAKNRNPSAENARWSSYNKDFENLRIEYAESGWDQTLKMMGQAAETSKK